MEISAVSPTLYAERFLKFLKNHTSTESAEYLPPEIKKQPPKPVRHRKKKKVKRRRERKSVHKVIHDNVISDNVSVKSEVEVSVDNSHLDKFESNEESTAISVNAYCEQVAESPVSEGPIEIIEDAGLFEVRVPKRKRVVAKSRAQPGDNSEIG